MTGTEFHSVRCRSDFCHSKMETLTPIVVDLRSDTVTKPSLEMRKAMAEAEVGDDVYREDPTILKLESIAAEFLGKEASLFLPSGTMGNLTAIMAHCWQRGRDMLVGDQSHIYLYEQGGSAHLAGVFPRALKTNHDGTFTIDELKGKLRISPDAHECLTGLICLENTHNRCGGKALPTKYVQEVCKIAKQHKIPVHMDGARIVNASVYLGESVASIVKDCDSVSMCLSKGIGAPSGSIVAGSKDFISRVFRCRKILGGAMRQVGVLGAAGIVALQSAEDRLRKDHMRARILADAIVELDNPKVSVDLGQVQTNMVILLFNKTSQFSPMQFVERMKTVTEKELKVIDRAITVKCIVWSSDSVRCVFHSDIHDRHLTAAVEKIRYVLDSVDND